MVAVSAGVAVVAAGTVFAVRSGLGADVVPATSVVAVEPGQAPDRAAVEFYVDGHGIRMGVRRYYNVDVELSTPRTAVGSDEDRGEYFVLDGGDNDGADLWNVSMPAGTGVLYEAVVTPDCGQPDSSPEVVFTLPGRTDDGRTFTDRVRPTNTEDFATAMRLWCRTGVTLQASGGSRQSDGHVRWTVQVVNGTDDAVRVEVPDLRRGTADWTGAAASVAPHDDVTMEVVGAGVTCSRGQQVPWAPDRIRVNGEASSPPVLSNWCAADR